MADPPLPQAIIVCQEGTRKARRVGADGGGWERTEKAADAGERAVSESRDSVGNTRHPSHLTGTVAVGV